MKKNEFLDEFNSGVRKMLNNGGTYTFQIFEVPDDDDKFLKWCNDFTSFRADFRNFNWIDYDAESKSIYLNEACKLDSSVYIDNPIPEYINGLDYADYEYVASLMIKKLLDGITLGKNYSSRDEGIDFYGFYSPYSSIYSKFLNAHAWYIGQVKCYSSKIKTNHLRELLGTIVLAKNGIWALDGRYSETLEVKNYDHIIPMFVARAYYSSDSIRLAKKYNIKLFDNLDIIFWLIIFYKKDIDSLRSDLETLKQELSR